MTDLNLNSILFNCCTDNREPVWSEFKSLEIGGCTTGHDGYIVGGVSEKDGVEFWTIYGRRHDGCAEAITDAQTRWLADLILHRLRVMSGGLPVSP